ncbi:hypothetical protein ACE4MG_005714, partial [Escherichia coli]
KLLRWMKCLRRWQRGGELMPLAAALMNLLVNLSQRFSIQYLEQLPLRQLFRLIKQLEKQHGNR